MILELCSILMAILLNPEMVMEQGLIMLHGAQAGRETKNRLFLLCDFFLA